MADQDSDVEAVPQAVADNLIAAHIDAAWKYFRFNHKSFDDPNYTKHDPEQQRAEFVAFVAHTIGFDLRTDLIDLATSGYDCKLITAVERLAEG